MVTEEILWHYNWSLRVKDILKIRVFKRRWEIPGKEFAPQYYSCAFMNYAGKEVFGLSSHSSSIVSQTISILEAYERLFMRTKGIKNSNGCAIHSSPEQSEKAAKFEVMERDAYLRFHYLGQIYSKKIYNHLIQNNNLIEVLQKNGIGIQIRLLGKNKHGFATLASANGLNAKNPFGITIGLGFKDSLECSIESAFSELIRMINNQFSNEYRLPPISFESFQSHSNPGVHEHISLGLDLQYGDFLKKRYEDASLNESILPDAPSFIVKTEKAILPGVETPELYFSYAQSEDLVNIKFGKDQKYIEKVFNKEKVLKFNKSIATHILG